MEFRKNTILSYVYDLICSMDNSKIGKSETSVCFHKDGYYGKIMFYDNGILELSVVQEETNMNLFHLHFMANNMEDVIEKITSFFQFLKEGNNILENEVDNITTKKRNVLLCCTSGLTTTYFAYLMQEAFDKYDSCVTVEATSIDKIDKVIHKFDYVFLAPQVSYKLDSLKEKYGDKVSLINSKDFASRNVNQIISIIK